MNPAAFDPGCVRVSLRWADGWTVAASVDLVRPDVAAFFVGRAAEAAVAMLPLVYSICSRAQGLAARLALAAARGWPTEPAIDAAVLAEARRERLLRLALDWPRALGQAERADLLAEGVRRVADAGFDDWLWERFQPHAEAMAVQADGAAGILPVCAAELGRAAAAPTAPNAGRAIVVTARGELIHELELDGERVTHFRVIAPTDRHFSADGPLARELAALATDSPAALRRAAELAVLRFDPCVRYEIAVESNA